MVAKIKLTRKELLKKPDEFLTFSGKMILLAKEHSRQLIYVGIILLAAIVIYLGFNSYTRYINKKGQETYNLAYYGMLKNMASDKPKEEMAGIEENLNKVIEKYGRSKTANLALPELAYIKFLKNEIDEAIILYKEFIDQLSDDDPYVPLGRIALAACYEEKMDYDKAIQTLEYITSGSDDFFKEQAMLSLARIYRASGKKEKSDEILKEFVEKFPASPSLSLAKSYLNS
ncbi:MAG: tetratricopeptide repeat protein [Deltaproteobacteria bacterium]|nr:tetratricopeptide repeat protein [Deltaproteobacteria bacterium]